ncbi:MAG: GGDEF domain-containing protein [Pseudomonadales bacterium]
MVCASDIQNRCFKALAELTAFTDLALLNAGLPPVLGKALEAELRFYATQSDYEDYELIGQSSAELVRKFPRSVSAGSSSLAMTAAQLGGDRTLFNKLGCKNFLACTSEKGARSLFQHTVNAEQKVFVVVHGVLAQEQIEFVRAGLQIYANQVKLLKRTTRDSLTNLLNRDAFERRMRGLYSRNGLYRRRSREQTCNGCFAIADIDNFKRVNDTYGHVYGDKVLVMFAQIMRDSFRDDDVLCRYGGEEFVIVLSDIGVTAAMKALQRFKDAVAATEFPQDVRVTVSIGCTQLNLEMSLDVMTARADKALYYAKTHGRNKLCHYEDLVDSEMLEHDAELFA